MSNLSWMQKMRSTKNYKGFVGPANKYNEIGLAVFELLKKLGLKGHHYLLDIGCGSLRVGKHLIPYLHKRHYYGIEPERWLVGESLKHEVDKEIGMNKEPAFIFSPNFCIEKFEKNFDFILIFSVFTHASIDQICFCLEKLKTVMKKNSVIIFNFFPGKMNKNKFWTYPQNITYSKEEIIKLFENYGFNCVEFKKPFNSSQTWMIADLKETELIGTPTVMSMTGAKKK